MSQQNKVQTLSKWQIVSHLTTTCTRPHEKDFDIFPNFILEGLHLIYRLKYSMSPSFAQVTIRSNGEYSKWEHDV